MITKPAVGKRRLLKLADFLQKLPRKRFDYQSWVGDDWQGKADLSCGTTACALGWATTIPSLRKAGLRLYKRDDGSGTYVTLKDRTSRGSEAAGAEVFGITVGEAAYLFTPEYDTYGLDEEFQKLSTSPGYTADAKAVAKHIRNFVKVKFSNKKA